MKNLFIIILVCLIPIHIFGQNQDKYRLLEDRFDEIAGVWLEKSGQLKTYQGVNEYCLSPEFRKSVDETLRLIHHFDSLILKKLNDPIESSGNNMKEEKKTIKNLEKLESDYSIINFIDQMKSSCLFRNDIEGNADRIKNSIAEESYDGKILILENELRNYLLRIDKLVLRIDDNLHLLHLPE